jgi:hypothetical protein
MSCEAHLGLGPVSELILTFPGVLQGEDKLSFFSDQQFSFA